MGGLMFFLGSIARYFLWFKASWTTKNDRFGLAVWVSGATHPMKETIKNWWILYRIQSINSNILKPHVNHWLKLETDGI